MKRISQKHRKFSAHLDLIDNVSTRTAEMIHKHIKSNLGETTEGKADEIGEKQIKSGRNNDVSPPAIFMHSQERASFNKSSPIKELSFFDSDNGKAGEDQLFHQQYR